MPYGSVGSTGRSSGRAANGSDGPVLHPDLPQSFRDVETPAGVVDPARVKRNAAAVADYAAAHGLRWRPHVKTHKCARVAELQLQAGAEGLTVATPREGEAMAPVCPDLLMAYPPVGSRALARLTALARGVRLSVALDSAEALEDLALHAHSAEARVGVLIEVDVGMGRMGVGQPEEALALAQRVRELDGVEYEGVLLYPGHVRMPLQEQGEALAAVRESLAAFLRALGEEGLSPATVSGGSTPTVWRSHELEGLTELRAGMVLFHDRDTLALGVGEWRDVAYAVLTTVVSTAVPGRAVVDAGSKALAKETLRSGGEGYGVVVEHPEVTVAQASEEHGVLDLSGTDWRPRVGERIRVIPNHVCVSVNLQEGLWAAEGALEPDPPSAPLEWWPLEGRGRRPLS